MAQSVIERAGGLRRTNAMLGVAFLVLLAASGASVAQTAADYYKGNDAGGVDLILPAGAVAEFNTDGGSGAGRMNIISAPPGTLPASGFHDAVLVNGVSVFNFRNVRIDSGATTNVTGTKPLSIAASRDLRVSGAFDVSGNSNFPNRAGGGLGGGGGTGGGGGGGGPGGSGGGAGQSGGAGGRGGGTAVFSGNDGEPGAAGNNGQNGSTGNVGFDGNNGTAGSQGQPGFGLIGSTGGAAGTPGNTAGTGGAVGGAGNGGTGGGGCGNPGPAGTGRGGCGGGGGSGDGGNGAAGGSGAAGGAGGTGGTGNTGGAGGAGGSGQFTASPNTLDLFAGPGGGGGGGGKGGGGGGGGGKGGGGQGGGGGGGGGSGCLGTGSGSHAPAGAAGGAGGNGGNGGTGGTGGNGAIGANGGGAMILSARGLLDVTGPLLINISSATPNAIPGVPNNAAGGSGGTFGSGGNPGSPQTGQGGGCDVLFDSFRGGAGGASGSGGGGGRGGDGGPGGLGGQGGAGGQGIPGMVKLHGSVVRASNLTLFAQNGPAGSLPENNGKLSIISNMTLGATQANTPPAPNLIPSSIQISSHPLFNPDTLGTTVFDFFNNHPIIPGMITVPATEGLLSANYWNKTAVDNQAEIGSETIQLFQPDGTPGGPGDRVIVKRLSSVGIGAPGVFQGFDQIVVINESTTIDADGLFLRVGSGTPRPINSLTGELDTGAVWTTTVLNGASVQLLQAPVIVEQPGSQSGFPGAVITFTAIVNSSTPLTYQWETNATGPWTQIAAPGTLPAGNGLVVTLTFGPPTPPPAIQESDQGNYRVVLQNATGLEGVVISNEAAFLNVFDPPVITTHPSDAEAVPGLSSFPPFEVEALGTVGPSYQWQFSPDDGVTPWADEIGATQRTYVVTNASLADEGYYRVIVTNGAGFAISNSAFLNLLDNPRFTVQPITPKIVPVGTNVDFHVEAAGAPPLLFNWYYCNPTVDNCTLALGPGNVFVGDWVELVIGVNNSVPNQSTINILSAQASNAGLYVAEVRNFAPTTQRYFSDVAELQINDPGVLVQPVDQIRNPGESHIPFTAVPIGTNPINFQWQYCDTHPAAGLDCSINGTGWVNLVGESGSIGSFSTAALNLGTIVEAEEGLYRVRFTNVVGSINTRAASLIVNNPPVIISEPQDLQRVPGDAAFFTVGVQSDIPLSYQWFKHTNLGTTQLNDDGIRVFGATSANLQILSLIQSDEARYSVVVSNTAGFVESRQAQLIIGTLLVIVPPVLGAGGVYVNTPTHEFSVTTTGGLGPRTYRWYKDNVLQDTRIANASPFTARLNLFDVTFSSAGNYRCDITDLRGTISTGDLPLAVYFPIDSVTIPLPPVNDLLTGQEVFFEAILSPPNSGIPPLTYTWEQETPDKAITTVGPNAASWTLGPLELTDAGTYTVTVKDSGSAPAVVSNAVVLNVEIGVPAVGGVGLGLLAGLSALAGAVTLRRRQK